MSWQVVSALTPSISKPVQPRYTQAILSQPSPTGGYSESLLNMPRYGGLVHGVTSIWQYGRLQVGLAFCCPLLRFLNSDQDVMALNDVLYVYASRTIALFFVANLASRGYVEFSQWAIVVKSFSCALRPAREERGWVDSSQKLTRSDRDVRMVRLPTASVDTCRA